MRIIFHHCLQHITKIWITILSLIMSWMGWPQWILSLLLRDMIPKIMQLIKRHNENVDFNKQLLLHSFMIFFSLIPFSLYISYDYTTVADHFCIYSLKIAMEFQCFRSHFTLSFHGSRGNTCKPRWKKMLSLNSSKFYQSCFN